MDDQRDPGPLISEVDGFATTNQTIYALTPDGVWTMGDGSGDAVVVGE